MPEVLKRVQKVRDFRLSSKAKSTRKHADTPTQFCQIAETEKNYLLVPRVSSQRRRYIPIGFMKSEVIANDQVLIVPGADMYHFGVLTSIMHMTWMRYTSGRLKSDYRYSKDIVYNNFPWPKEMSDQKKAAIERKAQKVLDVRENYPDCTLVDLYDPLTTPPDLLRSHESLDKTVDTAYRTKSFKSEMQRIEYLFGLYGEYTKGEEGGNPR